MCLSESASASVSMPNAAWADAAIFDSNRMSARRRSGYGEAGGASWEKLHVDRRAACAYCSCVVGSTLILVYASHQASASFIFIFPLFPFSTHRSTSRRSQAAEQFAVGATDAWSSPFGLVLDSGLARCSAPLPWAGETCHICVRSRVVYDM